MTIHKTVLLKETVDALNLRPGMVVVDATLGGGGHALEVLENIGETGTLIAFDRDQEAIDRFRAKVEVKRYEESGNLILVHDNYSSLKDSLTSLNITKVDAILADLGISSDQLESLERGISFQKDAPLDMRMDTAQGSTAADIVNSYSAHELEKILREFSDEKYARSIANKIVEKRGENEITRVSQLVEIIGQSVPGEYKRKKIHFATKTFQALRMEVNQELKSLSLFLSQAIEVLKPGGYLAIITFHSGEDALVKHTLRENARGCICPPEFPVCRCGIKPLVQVVTRKAIAPSVLEVEQNPRARSAKLRVVKKI